MGMLQAGKMPAPMGLVGLPHASPKRIKVTKSNDNTFI